MGIWRKINKCSVVLGVCYYCHTPHPSLANAVCLSVCVTGGGLGEKGERKRRGHRRPQCKFPIHYSARPNFRSKGRGEGKGREEVFSQNDSLLPSLFS